MAGKMAQYNAFNQLVDGTGYADAAQKAGGKLYDAAKKIPVLNRIVQPGFGEAAGRVLADTGADFVLDTYPSMMDDMDKFSADRQTAARGENVDDPMTVGRMAANAAKNLAGNVAMNALPEIGSAVLNGAKNSFSGAMLDEPLQEAAAVAGKSSRLDTRPDLPRADTPAAVDLEKNADAFLRDANSADAVKSVPDSTAANFTSTPQNAAQGLADSAADAPGVAVRERGYAASLRTNSDLPDAVKQDFVTAPEVYNQLSNAETKARADAVLAKGQGEAVTAYQNMLSQHDPAAVPLGYELAKQYIADGDSDSAVELLRGMSKELTASGQFSQAAAISLMQNDPMTALRYAQRSIDDLNAGGAKELGRRWKNFSLTDANKRAFDKQNGFLPFAIHVPGTNVYYRISDFQPSMMSVITGAAWAQAASGDETPEQAAKGAVVAFTNTLADNSNLSNIGDLFGNYDGLGGGLWDAALGLPQSMVPSLSNAIAKSTDTTVRNPYDATDPIQSQKNQIMAKIPGLSKELPAAYDTWGAEKLRDNAAFEQFLDPAAFTNQTTSSRDKEIQRLYEATGDIGVYPPSIKNGTDVDGLKLDNTQTSEYQRTAGQLNRQIVDEVMRTDEYRQADDATRVKMLKSAYEIGREAGKEAANPDYVSENSDYLAYKENGIRDALLTSSVGAVLDKARNEKREATGNADANLNKVERWNAIPSLDSYDDMVSAYLLNSSDDTAQKLYDKAGAEATAAYLDIYTATAKNGEDDDSANQLQTLQTALPVLRKYDMTTDQQMDVASMFLQKASPAIRVQEQYGSDMALKYLDAYTKADADGNGKVSDTEFKNALLQSPGLSDDDIGKIYLSSKTTDDSTDEKAQTFSATYGPAGVTNYLYLQYLERAYHTAEANRKIAAGEGGNPDGSFNKSDLVNALNYMNLTNEERRAYFSIVAPTWKNPY